MKKSTFTLLLLFMLICAYAQNPSEKEIRNLEEEARVAFLNKDTTTLLKLYSPNLIVNSPWNKVSTIQQILGRLRMGDDDRGSFEKNIENISFNNNIAIVMGVEILMPTGKAPNAGKTVKRRYTDIWMKDGGSWLLVARQSTVISVE